MSTKNNPPFLIIIFVSLLLFDAALWICILNKAKTLELDFLNVGQGDATLLKFPFSGRILIDAGDGQMIKSALAQVQNYFDRHIDIWILSHANLDHYGGFLKLLENNPPRLFIYNGFDADSSSFKTFKKSLKAKNIPIVILSASDKIKIGESYFEILWPVGRQPIKDLNDTSLILRLIYLKHSILFLGDASTKITSLLTNIQSEILKLSHHGSKTGTDENILNLIRPKIVLVGVGLNNRFSHPHQEVMDLLQKIGSQILRTDLNGTIKIIFNKDLLIQTDAN